MNRKIKKVFVNKSIRSPEVRVIDPEGKQLGIIPLNEALKAAEAEGLDLVEVAPNSSPPVCRIMDYGKFKYQQSKKAHEARKSQTTIQVKEVKMRPKTGEHDFQYKLRHIKKFLADGNKAKIHIIFRGREITHSDKGMQILNRIAEEVEEIGTIEQKPKLEGRNMAMVIAPKT